VQSRHLVAAGFGCVLAAGAISLAPSGHHANLSAASAELQRQPQLSSASTSAGFSQQQVFTKNLQAYLPAAHNPPEHHRRWRRAPVPTAPVPTASPTWTQPAPAPDPAPDPAPSSPPSGMATWQPPTDDPVGMSESAVAGYWMNNGGSAATVNDAVCIAWYESRWNADSISPTNDVGIWQINFVNAPDGDSWNAFVALLEDPDTNAQYAIRISDGGTNWQWWTTAGDCGL
jgi:Lysozyme like domain